MILTWRPDMVVTQIAEAKSQYGNGNIDVNKLPTPSYIA
jgi:hypothetical protein